ncbi:uncharacterized protein N7518_000835 [Penicillium psychrosexuale]|uniref:uncharacterized protein n=1 Tax=Penicillium psychrosexuale TaxID=1002107 RepID=UPI0025453238|nr:uncharacterized protein N7518_000835 [Penicillium psychrosexuale]KAJ5804532.1 hypothetical protein N7518_000835 [Penicillium psychrosexuale]
MFSSSVFCTALCLGASVYASDFASRSTPGVGEEFGLYAYGDSIGGLSLFYGDGKALIGDPANSTASNTSSVYFERSSTDSTWIANPNGTTNANASWSDQMLYIPSSSSSDDEMGFASTNASNRTTTGFIFYGQWMMVKSDSGAISSSFYIRENSEGEGIYSLLWNASDDASAIPVSLRSVKPSDA